MKLADAEKAIRAALDRIVALPLAAKPDVIVEDTVTGRFVQLCTIRGDGRDDKRLLIDLPLSHARGPQRLTERTSEMATLVLGKNNMKRFDDFTAFSRNCANAAEGARLAMIVLRRVLDLPEEAELTVETRMKPEYEAN